MKSIVMNTLAKVNKNFTLDEIKAVMEEECAKVEFEITNNDWNDMLTDLLYELAELREYPNKKGDNTMLDVLYERLIDGLTVKTVKETHAKYTLCFEYEGETAKADLPKSCAPNCENKVADNSIITAMSTIYFNRGDFVKAKEWLDKLIS